MTARRPNRPCHGCGRKTQALSQWCIPCRPAEHEATRPLPPGRWVPTGRGTVVYRVSATGLSVRGAA